VNNAAGASLAAFGVPALSGEAFDLFAVGDSLASAAPVVSLFVDGAAGSIEGALTRLHVSADAVALPFDVVRDDVGLFGGQVLMVLTGDFSVGLVATDASVAINPVAPIPLPAGLPLLATALALAAAAARRRAA
jgi:hypothetical protein